MLHQLPTLQKLIRQLQKVPYLASKNVYRVMLYFLTIDQKTLESLCSTILEAKKMIKPCSLCLNWAEGEALCSICASPNRDKKIICIVETWLDLSSMEKSGDYKGVYHVLGGALCPLEGIGPDNLSIGALLKRIDADVVKEIIFATNPTPEGEATASFIFSKIKKDEIAISRLASGVPTGSSLEFMDRITISKALAGRRPF